ncbi:MAG TPA: LytTR family DNA-binding domain-containing protein, partial [Thermoanaerobaculia bacterium]
FFAALLRAKDRARQRARGKEYVSRYLVRVRDRVVLVKTADVDWIEAADYYVTLHAGPESYLLRRSLAEIEAELDPRQFIRVHRSAIVNIDRVKEMHSLFRGDSLIVLRDGTNVRLSRARREEFERRLKEPRSVF